ncbi:carboxylesterase [Noviherbaspirillum humi]|uniref:Carboxylesterase n=1 Tax=Noviherbaspirillum humi TaxID=1688639 RepID=A0A239I5K5_9BURK|nr:alpha/beta fold hydrolase [Noviherbaspirillum humi]SNS89156.1 carboxylesterase [Noviherbaspirillum humi]
MIQTSDQNLHKQAGEHVVMLIHGMGANILEVDRLAQHLHGAGLSVFAPNIRGFCHGTPASGWENWLEQAATHVRRLKQDYATVSLAGVSMGATLALAVAEEEELDSLVLLATALAYDGWAMPWYRFLLKMLPIVPFKERYSYREREPFGLKNPEMRAMVRKALLADRVSEMGGDSISLKHTTEGLRLIAHVRRHIASVSAPTLLMHAIEDETVSIGNAEWIHDNIASASKELIYLGDCYHMITIDNERETVMQETERFIKRSLNASQPAPAFEQPPLLSRELRRLLRGGG